MAIPESKKPIFDRRVQQILQGLSEGKSREELASTLGYTNPRSLDTYIRRKNFVWDGDQGNYVPSAGSDDSPANNGPHPLASAKAAMIIKMFAREDSDAKAIAKQLGFSDHREMADYMRGKGFAWDAGQNNYARIPGQVSNIRQDREPEPVPMSMPVPKAVEQYGGNSEDISRYLPLLQMLEENSDRLSDLLHSQPTGEIPRYAIPGIPVTKSVHMMSPLDQMVRDFSREKNISQRDLFEVALLEFFRRYGYQREVENLLKQS